MASDHPDHQGHGKPRRCRDIYLKIEKLPAYSPVAPENGEHDRYGRDCMRNHGHENTRIPQAEIERRRVDAVVYREYLDAGYTVPNMAKLVEQDLIEPRWDQRIPGAVLYAEPGERLRVHVFNDDTDPHSFHVHGLDYGIDSDGAWPFGVAAADGRRSDAICPGETWCYIFDVTRDTIGCWPFHDHVMDIEVAVNRGLFGGLVVRDRKGSKPRTSRCRSSCTGWWAPAASRRSTAARSTEPTHSVTRSQPPAPTGTSASSTRCSAPFA
jgi:hypothetical protein